MTTANVKNSPSTTMEIAQIYEELLNLNILPDEVKEDMLRPITQLFRLDNKSTEFYSITKYPYIGLRTYATPDMYYASSNKKIPKVSARKIVRMLNDYFIETGGYASVKAIDARSAYLFHIARKYPQISEHISRIPFEPFEDKHLIVRIPKVFDPVNVVDKYKIV